MFVAFVAGPPVEPTQCSNGPREDSSTDEELKSKKYTKSGHEAIVTTEPKAKALRGYVEPLITLARGGGLANIRLAERSVKDAEVLAKLFDELGPRYADRAGGYTRIHKLGERRGDNAPMARISLV